MKPLKQLLIAITLLSVQITIAQTPTWKNITPPGWSGTFKQVINSPGNGLVALGNNGYLYQSKDTARTWTQYTPPDTAMIAITMYPDNTRGFIHNGKTVYKTGDGAISWTKMPMTGIPADMQIRTLWIKNADTVFAVVTNLINGVRIFLSPDKGNTWTQVAENIRSNVTYQTIYSFYFPSPLIGFGYGYDLYTTTTDGGKTWVNHRETEDQAQSYTKTFSYPNGRTVIFFDNKILLSSNGDPATATQVGNTSAWVNDAVGFGADVYAIDDFGNFYYSTDSGSTWKSRVILNRASHNHLNSMCFFNKDTGVVVSPDLTSLVTTDGGVTFTKYVHGAADGFNKIYCKTKDECYITGNAGRLFHTTDGGDTWTYRDLQGGTLVEVEFPTNDTGFVSGGGVIFRTIDAGQTWTKFKQPTGGGFIDFPTKDTGFVGYSNGSLPDIAKTTDGGQTWNTWLADMTYATNKRYGGGVCFRSTTEGLVSGDNCLLYTNDGGSTWQVKAKGIGASAIIPVNDNWLIVNGIGVYLCDKNVNCVLKHSIDSNYNLGMPVKRDLNTIYLSQSYEYNNITDSLLVSNDGGNTWESTQDSSYRWMYSFGGKNTVYSLLNGIFKSVIKSQTISSRFTKTDNQTIQCTITNDANEGYSASVLLITDMLDTVVINKNVFIDNGTPLSIKIPAVIQVGTIYKILIQPIDTIAYSKVESQTFTVTGIKNLEIEKFPLIKVIENRIVCECTNLEIYNTLGQRMQTDTELPAGIYIVKCNNITKKVIIKP